MITDHTVFVIGAGASAEYGFPTGTGLLKAITNSIDGSTREKILARNICGLRVLLYSTIGARNTYVYDQIAQTLANGIRSSQSIDEYLWTIDDPKVAELAKVIIASIILDCETNSIPKLHDDGPYKLIWDLLSNEVSKKEFTSFFRKNKVAFINFNYDRSLGNSLYQFAAGKYSLPKDVVDSAFKEIKIFHPYGQVGGYPWQFNKHGETAYGTPDSLWEYNGMLAGYGNRSATTIEDRSKCIRTYTEQVDDQDKLVQLQRTIEEAKKIVFLGFGYLKMNMRLLFPETYSTTIGQIIYGTAHGISEVSLEEIKSKLCARIKRNPAHISPAHYFEHIKSQEFLRKYRHALENYDF